MKKNEINRFFLLLVGTFLLLTCSVETPFENIRPDPPNELPDLKTYIIPSMIASRAETRGMPIDTVTQMTDFGFFCSYSNQNMWDSLVHNTTKMYNRKMVPYYDVAPYAHILLWMYADAPIVEWGANSAADHYTFFGYAPFATGVYNPSSNPNGNGVTVTTSASTAGIPAVSYTVPLKVENQPDLMFAVPVKDLVPTGHPVQLHMKHALTAVGFRVAGNFSEKITQISISGVYISGNISMDGREFDWALTGSKTTADFSASIDFDAGQSYRTVTPSLTNPLKSDGWLMMIPQELESTAKVTITFTDGSTREVSLMIDPTTNVWEAGKRVIYDIYVTPGGTITVFPGNIVLPYYAQVPSSQYITVVCELMDGAPNSSANWTLEVPPAQAHWLQLTLDPNPGAIGSSTVSGSGTQQVYFVVPDHYGPQPPRSAGLSLNDSPTPVVTVSQVSLPGDNFSGWLYVRQGAIGHGYDWGNAVSTIGEAITMAQFLIGQSYPFSGILVAGGSLKVYNEVPSITTAGIKIFGGWEGIPGTELPSGGDPYTSMHRDLILYKTIVNIGAQTITVSGSGSALDGFIVQGATGAGAINVNNQAYINAIEMRGLTFGSGSAALTVDNATAVNVLLANNNRGVTVSNGGKLINATIVNSTGTSTITNATMYNSVIWNHNMTFSGANTVQYCAFPLDNSVALALDPNNIALHANNTAWITTTNLIPGPHFNFNNNVTKPYYSALDDRAPMLGRGHQDLFDNNTPFMTSPAAKKDINGYPRHYEFTDMGCYEDPHLIGFRLRWGSDRVYISSRNGTVNQIPLMLPENEFNQIAVDWTVTVTNVVLPVWSISPTPPISGSGTGVVVGMLNITTTANYTAGAERHVGTLLVHSNLGGYLADTEIEIWQVPGTSALWENGYVGSFHRNNETSERYITGENSYAYFPGSPGTGSGFTAKAYYRYWSARIVSGMDWIKIDTNPKGFNGGDVVETYGGVINGETPSDSDPIRFRVGLKSTLPPGAPPRYGLIVISRGNSPNLADGATWFFVRQGEEADYLYRPTNVPGVTPDPRTAGTGNRNNAKKYSPFNLTAPSSVTMANGGVNVRAIPSNPSIAVGVSHPTKIGDFFQRNGTVAYRRPTQTTALPTNFIFSYTPWNQGKEVCPSGYRHPSYPELFESLYLNLVPSTTTTVPPEFTSSGGGGAEAMRAFMWGYYADGYFDQIAPDPVLAGNHGNSFLYLLGGTGSTGAFFTAVTTPNTPALAATVAAKGMLMVNHANFASLFFPMAGTMSPSGPTGVGQSYSIANPSIDGVIVPSLFTITSTQGITAFYPTTFWATSANFPNSPHNYGTTHWVSGHVGLACTQLTQYGATNVRCIKDE